MRRRLVGALVVLLAMAGVMLYGDVTRHREFRRLITAGDAAALNDQASLGIESYSGALALRPDSMAVYLKRGETYRRHGDLQAAVRDLTMATTLDPGAARPHERLGDVSLALAAPEDAIDYYSRYLQLDDRNALVLYKLALASQRAGRVARAVPLLRRAIDLDDRFVEAYYLLGLCLREQDRLEEARETLTRAVELSPGLLDARDALADVSRRLGDPRGALEQVDALAALDPADVERQVARGLAYADAGQSDLAVLALGRAAAEHPDQPAVQAALGRVWLRIAEQQRDRAALRRALDAFSAVPGERASSETLALHGRALRLAGRETAARRTLELAIERFPVAPDAFLQLARLDEAAWRWEDASRRRRQHRALTATPSAARSGASIPPTS